MHLKCVLPDTRRWHNFAHFFVRLPLTAAHVSSIIGCPRSNDDVYESVTAPQEANDGLACTDGGARRCIITCGSPGAAREWRIGRGRGPVQVIQGGINHA